MAGGKKGNDSCALCIEQGWVEVYATKAGDGKDIPQDGADGRNPYDKDKPGDTEWNRLPTGLVWTKRLVPDTPQKVRHSDSNGVRVPTCDGIDEWEFDISGIQCPSDWIWNYVQKGDTLHWRFHLNDVPVPAESPDASENNSNNYYLCTGRIDNVDDEAHDNDSNEAVPYGMTISVIGEIVNPTFMGNPTNGLNDYRTPPSTWPVS